MSRELDPLQKSLVQDLHKVISKNKQLHDFWHILPDSGREAVEDAYLEMVWQMIFSAGLSESNPNVPPSDLKQALLNWGAFTKTAMAGKLHVEFETKDWVAMDRKRYDALVSGETQEKPESEEVPVDIVSYYGIGEKDGHRLVGIGLTDDMIAKLKRVKDFASSSDTHFGAGLDTDLIVHYRPTLNELVKDIEKQAKDGGAEIESRMV